MGPRLMSRGKTTDPVFGTASRTSFNGAAAHEPRKVAVCPCSTQRQTWLQWGRGS